MAELKPPQEGADSGRTLEPPLVEGPRWTSDRQVISREWVAFKEDSREASWNMIPYAAVSSAHRDDFGRIVLSRPDGLTVVISTNALYSLEACTLLTDGLRTNPAVAPNAAKLLQSYLAAAQSRSRRDSSLTRRHTVDRTGRAHTFCFRPGALLFVGILLVGLSGGGGVGVAVGVSNATGSWNIGYVIGFAAIMGFALFGVWMGIRAPFAGVKIGDGKMTIRNFWRTYTVNTSKICAITVEYRQTNHPVWQAQVWLLGGRRIWLHGLSTGEVNRGSPPPELVKTVDEVRALLERTALPSDSPAPES
jgi:hypothetical protein